MVGKKGEIYFAISVNIFTLVPNKYYMSRYKLKKSPKRENMSAADKAQEKKFFQIAIVVTIVVILIIYFIMR